MTILDSFDRADAGVLGTSDTGQVWTANRGNWGISGNAAKITDSSGYGYVGSVASLETLTYIQEVSAIVHAQPSGFGQGCGVVCRLQDGDNFWFAMLYTSGVSGVLRLYSGKIVANVASYVLANDLAISSTFPCELKITVSVDDIFNVYIDDVLKAGPVTDSVFSSATKAGIHSYDIPSLFDSFAVEEILPMKQRIGIPI